MVSPPSFWPKTSSNSSLISLTPSPLVLASRARDVRDGRARPAPCHRPSSCPQERRSIPSAAPSRSPAREKQIKHRRELPARGTRERTERARERALVLAMFPVRPASARRALQASSSSGRSGRGRSLLARANPPAVREREEALAVIAPFKRGQGATGPERKRILDKLERLEASNTTSALDIRDRISGNWVLLYQAPTKDLDELTDYEKKAVTVEGVSVPLPSPVPRSPPLITTD